MITSCPHCRKALQLSESQKTKLQQALQALEPGKTLNLKCPACSQNITLGRDGDKGRPQGVVPPAPPDVSWLREGHFEVEEKMEDVPRALVMHPDPAVAKTIQQSMETVGYQVMRAATVSEGMDKLRFLNFSCIVLHECFESANLNSSVFHQYMRQLPMNRRRYIFYILIGVGMQTLYDLQALSLSANLVIGDGDLNHMDVILRKAIPDYEELFGPLLEELSAYGKK